MAKKRLTKHWRHQTPPSPSTLAALSSFLPQPGSSFLSRPRTLDAALVFLPPQIKHDACHLVPCGPGTTPRSIGETAFRQPGHVLCPPKRGYEALVGDWAGASGASYRLEEESNDIPDFNWGNEGVTFTDVIAGDDLCNGLALMVLRTTTSSLGAHCDHSFGEQCREKVGRLTSG